MLSLKFPFILERNSDIFKKNSERINTHNWDKKKNQFAHDAFFIVLTEMWANIINNPYGITILYTELMMWYNIIMELQIL